MNVMGMTRTPKFVSKYPLMVDKIHMGNFASDIRTAVNKSFKKIVEFIYFGIQNFVGKRRLT